MSQILIPGNYSETPYFGSVINSFIAAITLNAAGETCHMIGNVFLENPLGGSKTISTAGSGKIIWSAGTVTFANAGTTFKVGIQDVSTVSSPAQGDGTFDVEASFTGGGGGITTSAVNTSTMTAGTKTLTHGQLISITFSMTARGGTDSVIVNGNGTSKIEATASTSMPMISDNTGGTYARTAAYPNAVIQFDDGTYGYIVGTSFVNASGNAAINVGTATADEYGNYLNLLVGFQAIGIGGSINYAGNSSDLELLLYSDPLGTPAVQRTITVDATQVGATAAVNAFMYLFSSPYYVKPNTPHAITFRPTTANNITIYYKDSNTSAAKVCTPNTMAYCVRRLDNTGAFSDFNGGTAKTRLASIWLVGAYDGQDQKFSSYRLGL